MKTFADFVVSSPNRFAHAVCLSVAEAPGEFYNPLIVLGDAGTGKSHLLEAIGERLAEYDSPRVARELGHLYARRLTGYRLYTLLRNDEVEPLSADIWLVDDVGSDPWSISFLHAVVDSGRQLVATAAGAPADVPQLIELSTAYQMGLLVSTS